MPAKVKLTNPVQWKGFKKIRANSIARHKRQMLANQTPFDRRVSRGKGGKGEELLLHVKPF